MNIKILSAAETDLEEGYRFYEAQDPGVGSYFLASLYSDIDSLAYFGGHGISPVACETVPFCRVLPCYR